MGSIAGATDGTRIQAADSRRREDADVLKIGGNPPPHVVGYNSLQNPL